MSSLRSRWRRARWSRVWYRTLLLTYPAAFRREHGQDATDVFADVAHAEACRGNVALLRLWLRSVPAVVRGGLQERREMNRSHPDPSGPSWRFETMLSELRHSLRALLRRPGFTVTAVLTLALGIGATTAVFSVVDGVLLRPLPYPDADRLVDLSHSAPELSSGDWGLSSAGYFYFREHADLLDSVGVYSTGTAVINLDGEPERIDRASVSASLMTTLGVAPAIGRPISSADDTPGAAPVALLSHGFFTRAFGGDESVVGRQILLSGTGYDVIGVMPEGFGFPSKGIDAWVPSRLDPDARPVNSHYLDAVARLRNDASAEEARAELAGLLGRFPEEMPTAYGGGFIEQSGFRVNVRELLEHTVGDTSTLLWIVLAAAALVLAIACANVANLTMLR